jgi:uroporphyrinogen-III decarboxylase
VSLLLQEWGVLLDEQIDPHGIAGLFGFPPQNEEMREFRPEVVAAALCSDRFSPTGSARYSTTTFPTRVGIDAKHSNEDQIAPFDKWIELYGKRIGLFGGIDVNTLCRNKYEEVYREVLEKGTRFREKAKGYGLGSGNSIPEYVPVEGFMAMVDAAKEIRRREGY